MAKNNKHKDLLDQIVDSVNILTNKETGAPLGFDMSKITDKDLLDNEEYLKTLAHLNAYQTKLRQLERYLEIIQERGKKKDDEKRVADKIEILKAKIIMLNMEKKKYEKEKL